MGLGTLTGLGLTSGVRTGGCSSVGVSVSTVSSSVLISSSSPCVSTVSVWTSPVRISTAVSGERKITLDLWLWIFYTDKWMSPF